MIKIGFLGLGQVGGTLSKGLSEHGFTLFGYDKQGHEGPLAGKIQEACKASNVELVETPERLAREVDWIISVTAPKYAVETARSIAPFLKPDQIYMDFNSAVPKVKAEVEQMAAPASFIDGAILGSLSQFGHQVPVVLSGQESDKVSAVLREGGMDVTAIGSQAGQASALKIIRSIFTKGMECILLECLHAAKKYDVDAVIQDSVIQFLQDQPLDSTINMLITTNALHAERRSGEMEGVTEFLKESGVNSIMSAASAEKLKWSSSLGLRDVFENQIPEQMDGVLQALLRRDA